jgi:hypothetical protein
MYTTVVVYHCSGVYFTLHLFATIAMVAACNNKGLATMTETAIGEAAHKAGAEAFCKAMRKTAAEVVEDERLFEAFGTLWDCGTLAELQRCVEDAARIRATDATGIMLERARAAWLEVVSAQVGVADAPPAKAQRQRQAHAVR